MTQPKEIIGTVIEIVQPSSENYEYGYIVLELQSSNSKWETFRKMDLPKGEITEVDKGDVILVSFWLNGRYGKKGSAHENRVFNSDQIEEITIKDPIKNRYKSPGEVKKTDIKQNKIDGNFGNVQANKKANSDYIPF